MLFSLVKKVVLFQSSDKYEHIKHGLQVKRKALSWIMDLYFGKFKVKMS